MNKLFLLITILLLSSIIYAREVPGTNQGIANASPGDYIIRSSGEKVILTQADIIYARKQLGLQSNQQSPYNNTVSGNYNSNSNDDDKRIIIIIVIACIAHIILTFCVYKMKGGYFACFYFFLAPIALLVLLFGLEALSKASRKRDIHHHFH